MRTRVALVVGNAAYQHTEKLENPKNDAANMAAALKKHGFEVVEGFDLDKAAFDRKVREFSAALESADAGLFFYAGHCLQVAGQNYLVPIDAKAGSWSADTCCRPDHAISRRCAIDRFTALPSMPHQQPMNSGTETITAIADV